MSGTSTQSIPQPAPPGGLVRVLLKAPVWLFRAHLGLLLGHRVLVLVHVGRRTGRERRTALEVVRYDSVSREAVVVAGWGAKTQWLHNVEAGLAREVWIGRDRFVPTYRRLSEAEAEAVLDQYEEHSGVPKRVVRAGFSWLLGWRYDGSAAARHRAVAQLPMLAFRPRLDEPAVAT